MNYTKNAEYLIKQVLIPLWEKVQKNELVNDTVEIINANLIFDATDTKLDLGKSRPPQHKYIENELNWYLSQDRYIKGHPGIEDNKIWRDICSTEEGKVNSNYGWCVFSPENGNIRENKSQYNYALGQLVSNPCGRQSVINYGRPQIQWEWNDRINAKSDFICTFVTQHFIRNKKLDYIVYMRSNDIIRGLHCGDLPWHGYVYDQFIQDLKQYEINVNYGYIYWNAGSLHCYKRDFSLLEKIIKEYEENVNKSFDKNGTEKIR